MQTKKYNNGQRPSPPTPKTGPNLQRTIKVILGCQKTNGINPRSAIRPHDHPGNYLPDTSYLRRLEFRAEHCNIYDDGKLQA
jgi:hypothetical protein